MALVLKWSPSKMTSSASELALPGPPLGAAISSGRRRRAAGTRPSRPPAPARSRGRVTGRGGSTVGSSDGARRGSGSGCTGAALGAPAAWPAGASGATRGCPSPDQRQRPNASQASIKVPLTSSSGATLRVPGLRGAPARRRGGERRPGGRPEVEGLGGREWSRRSGSATRSARSSPSDGWRRSPRRCRRGSIRRTAGDRATGGSSVNFGAAPNSGRRPRASAVKMRASRSVISCATS